MTRKKRGSQRKQDAPESLAALAPAGRLDVAREMKGILGFRYQTPDGDRHMLTQEAR